MRRVAIRPLALCAIVAIPAAMVGAQAPALNPTLVDKFTARQVVQKLERGHMAKPTIDDAISKKWCRAFLKDLDPQKYYFLKADIDEFLKSETDLDDKIREGDVDFAKVVIERWIARSDERYKVVQDLLTKTPDFTIDEDFVDDVDKLEYPVDAAQAAERWRKRIKLDWLQEKIDGAKDEDIVKKLTIRYRDRNRSVHQLTTSDLLRIYLTSLTNVFDPHSSYMPPNDWDSFKTNTLVLSLSGIGASLSTEDGFAVIKELIPDGPADKDGRLGVDDKILGIQNEDGTEIDFVEKKLDDVVKDIRGKAGTKVRLIIQPSDTKDRKIYELVRAKVDLKESHAKGTIIPARGADGKDIMLGVISLPAFYGDTIALHRNEADAVSATADCRKLIRGFKNDKVDAVVIDLRGNGGGLLSEAITLSGLFIDHGTVVQVKDVSGVKALEDDEEGTEWDGPMVVLIDRFSASASEIFAGVIKDYGRGLIVGDASTFGKGTVQQIVEINESFGAQRGMPKMGALKVTIQQFYRANGESTQIKGVPSDIHIPSLKDVSDLNEGKMDNAVKFDQVEARPHDMYNRVPSDLVSQVEARSAERRKNDPKFKKLDEEIKKVSERKARHAFSLNEAKFRAEFVPEEDGEEKPKDKKKNRNRFGEKPVWEANYYNDEVVRIISDYLTIGSKIVAQAPVRAARVPN